MILNWTEMKIYIKPGETDMRKQINGLSVIVEKELKLKVFDKSVFIFCNRNRKRLKILYWDRNGFCLWLKRLEKDRYPWPRDRESAEEITIDQLKMLLDGIDFFNAHSSLNYTSVL